MARGFIPTLDPWRRRRVDFGRGSTIASTSARAWPGLTLEKFIHETLETPEFLVEDHCVVLHVSPAARVEHKIHGSYRGYLHGPGNICLSPAGAPRQLRSREPHTVLVLAISPTLFGRAGVEPSLELIAQRQLRDARVEHVIRALALEAEDGFPSGTIFGESLGIALAVHLAAKHAGSRAGLRESKGGMAPRKLRRVVDYIDGHLERDLRLSDLAVVAGLSEHRFAHNFKTATGLSPHRYVIDQKIARAKRLLRESTMSVTEIGFALGFTQPSRFSSVFARCTGLTPSAYRQSAR